MYFKDWLTVSNDSVLSVKAVDPWNKQRKKNNNKIREMDIFYNFTIYQNHETCAVHCHNWWTSKLHKSMWQKVLHQSLKGLSGF